MPKKSKSGKVRNRTLHEFNPCRPRAKGRNSERVFWVEELLNGDGKQYKDVFETAAEKWARAEEREGRDENTVELYKSNIPGTPSDTQKMLDTLAPMIAKKFGQKFVGAVDDDGELSIEITPLKGKAKAEAVATKSTKKSKKTAVKAADSDDEDEDEDEDTDEDDEDED